MWTTGTLGPRDAVRVACAPDARVLLAAVGLVALVMTPSASARAVAERPVGAVSLAQKGCDQRRSAVTGYTKWARSMGCGTSGSGSVPWTGWLVTYQGKSSYLAGTAMPEVRAKVQPGFLGGAYAWRH